MGKLANALAGMTALLAASGANATETTNYRYDALGRLIESAVIGGAVGSKTTTITYDRAGNRATYQVSSATSLMSPSAPQAVAAMQRPRVGVDREPGSS